MMIALCSFDALVIVHHSFLLCTRKPNSIDGTRSELNVVVPRFVIIDVLLVARCDLAVKFKKNWFRVEIDRVIKNLQ